MPSQKTGHAEIDQQHVILESMVGQLASFCAKSELAADASCDTCGSTKQQQCNSSLTEIASELTAFLIGHATYEERMMELLPETPNCQAHIKAHKAAHNGIARQLKKIAGSIAEDKPRAVGKRMWQVVGDWLGDHVVSFDYRLVRLRKPAAPEIDFDGELVAMLDQYVFPNRPTMVKSGTRSAVVQQRKKIELRGRFESLSPAQRQVFWLVVSGKKSREIAESLGVTVNTIKTHRAAIFQKMDVRSVLELVQKSDVLR